MMIFHGGAMREKINGNTFCETNRISNGGSANIEVSSWLNVVVRALFF